MVCAKGNGKVTIEARPGPITIDVAKTAVIVVDMQNDFGAKGGMFDRGGLDISGIQAAVAPTARVLAAAREAGIKVIYITMQFRHDLSDVGAEDTPNFIKHSQRFRLGEMYTTPDGEQSGILLENTWNTRILSELTPEPGDIIVPKHRYSAFYGTDLDMILRSLGTKHLIITGCTTSVCVDSTIRDATFRDYGCILLEDCSAEPVGNNFARTNHEATLLTVEVLFGWVSDSERFQSALASK